MMADPLPQDIIDLSDDTFDFEDYLQSDLEESVEAVRLDSRPSQNLAPIPSPSRSVPRGVTMPVNEYDICLQAVLEVFPDIAHDHVKKLYNEEIQRTDVDNGQRDVTAQPLIEQILDKGKYPKEKDRIRELKRKRSDRISDGEEAARWKYAHLRDDPTQYAKVAKAALQEHFLFVPVKFIHDAFKEHGHFYGAFFAILEAERGLPNAQKPSFTSLRTRRSSNMKASVLMERLRGEGYDFEALKKEMSSAFQRRAREDEKRRIAKDAELAEAVRDQELRTQGEVMECGCCFSEFTVVKVTHCNGEEPHFFCLDCARENANNEIGKSQYSLECMDMSQCKATFSREQKARFLDQKTIDKLERLQQQDEIRKAEMENLSCCPFCDFAAICPPIEVDREFRCYNPECEEVSCRLCNVKSHVPLSCEEFKKEHGVSERRIIEEARTEALIRTCAKCKVRILKEDGCNKVICTSCYAVLCDYCGQDITKVLYNHFDGQGRAPAGLIKGSGGKCPLYDESSRRKDEQVDQAGKEAMAKVRLEHPDLTEEDLRIKFAKSVQSSENNSHGGPHHPRGPGPHHHYIPPRFLEVAGHDQLPNGADYIQAIGDRVARQQARIGGQPAQNMFPGEEQLQRQLAAEGAEFLHQARAQAQQQYAERRIAVQTRITQQEELAREQRQRLNRAAEAARAAHRVTQNQPQPPIEAQNPLGGQNPFAGFNFGDGNYLRDLMPLEGNSIFDEPGVLARNGYLGFNQHGNQGPFRGNGDPIGVRPNEPLPASRVREQVRTARNIFDEERSINDQIADLERLYPPHPARVPLPRRRNALDPALGRDYVGAP